MTASLISMKTGKSCHSLTHSLTSIHPYRETHLTLIGALGFQSFFCYLNLPYFASKDHRIRSCRKLLPTPAQLLCPCDLRTCEHNTACAHIHYYVPRALHRTYASITTRYCALRRICDQRCIFPNHKQ